jgi:hypothetical protein
MNTSWNGTFWKQNTMSAFHLAPLVVASSPSEAIICNSSTLKAEVRAVKMNGEFFR